MACRRCLKYSSLPLEILGFEHCLTFTKICVASIISRVLGTKVTSSAGSYSTRHAEPFSHSHTLAACHHQHHHYHSCHIDPNYTTTIYAPFRCDFSHTFSTPSSALASDQKIFYAICGYASPVGSILGGVGDIAAPHIQHL